MPDISYEFLTRFFQEHLPFLPTPKQVADFQADLALVSPYLMEASLVEVKAGTQGYLLIYRPNEWRPAVFSVYNRKVAEHAQLFPIFHSFETAMRSSVAVSLEQHYQHARWWRAIYETILRDGNPKDITNIGGQPITRRAAFRIGQIVRDLDRFGGGVVEPIKNGYEFLHCCNLGHIKHLIEEHWSTFSDKFSPLTLADFLAKFERIRNARNDVYHHKSVSGMTDVVIAAEELLDRLGFSLQFVYEKISKCGPSYPAFQINIDPQRHRTWA